MTLALIALVSLGPLSTDLYLAALPVMREAFAVSVSEVQLTLSAFLLGFAFSQPIYGPLSDRFGRRVTVLTGMTLYVIATAACFFAPNIETLIAARFLQALGACSGPVVGRAMIRDIYGMERSATMLAYMGTAMSFALMGAPIAGGYITVWFGWQANFIALMGVGIGVFLCLYFLVGETNRWKDPRALEPIMLVRNATALFAHARYFGYVMTSALVFSGLFAFISGSSFVLVDVLGVPVSAFGTYFALVVSGYIIGTFSAAKLNRKFGIDRLISVGTTLCLASGMVMLAAVLAGYASALAVVGAMMVNMIGVGLALPPSQAGAVGPFPRTAGLASALLGTVQMGAAAVVGFFVGALHDGTAVPMAAIIAGAGALSFLWFRFVALPVAARRAGGGAEGPGSDWAGPPD